MVVSFNTWKDTPVSWRAPADLTPASRDREEARDARRFDAEPYDYVRIGDTIYHWSDLPSPDEL